MRSTTGLVLLGPGDLRVALGIPRGEENLRPFLRSPFAQAICPSACLALLATGAAVALSNLL